MRFRVLLLGLWVTCSACDSHAPSSEDHEGDDGKGTDIPAGSGGSQGGEDPDDAPPNPVCQVDCEEEDEVVPPGCTSGADSEAPCRLPPISQAGALWVDDKGQKVDLRGTNLGNWLILEFWMMSQAMRTNGATINDQCTLEDALSARFSFAEKERLMGIFRDSWMTERDWDLLQDLGMNVVRVPFLYSLLEDEQNPYTLRADAFEVLDDAVDEAEERGMYTILDLHGAVGSQGWEHHSGCAEKNELWGSQEYRARTKWLWGEIAKHYKGRSAVAAYGLLNEPWGTDAETLADFATELYFAARAEDDAHVIVLPGHNTGGISAYGDPKDRGMNSHVAFEMHFYPGFWGWRENDPALSVHIDWLHCSTSGTGETCDWRDRILGLETPMLIGEFQPWTALAGNGGFIGRKTYDIYNMYGWAGTSWAYKTVSYGGHSGDPNNGWGWGMVTNKSDGGQMGSLDVSTAPLSEIEEFFRGFATQELVAHPDLVKWMAYKPEVGERILAELFQSHEGVRIEPTTDEGGGFNASNIDVGDTMTYPLHVPAAGDYTLEFRVASPAGGSLSLARDGNTIVPSLTIPATGGWQTWTTLTQTLHLEAGESLFTVTSGGGGWNFGWWRVVAN